MATPEEHSDASSKDVLNYYRSPSSGLDSLFGSYPDRRGGAESDGDQTRAAMAAFTTAITLQQHALLLHLSIEAEPDTSHG